MRLKRKLYHEKLNFEYFINVTSEGIFTAYLPENIVKKLELSGIEVGRGRGGKKGYFEATSLSEIENDVAKATEKYSKKSLLSSKIVLRYDIITTCTYCKTKKGEIVPNGYWKKRADKTDGCNWLQGTKDMDVYNREPFGFRIYVNPQRLNIYDFPDKTKHKEYVNVEEGDIKKGSTLDWLNSLCAMDYEDENNIKDIDYSEDIGKFFKSAILYICNMNEKLKDIFGDKIDISQANLKLLPNLKLMETK